MDESALEKSAHDEETCLFCTATFPPGLGSPEHVFLSSIGGRVVTNDAICAVCNNAFSNAETNQADQALRAMLLNACNALNIISGRGDPPPTIEKAYEPSPGVFFDLAPGLVLVPRRAAFPRTEDLTEGTHGLVAASEDDARRVLDIVKRREREFAYRGLKVTVEAPDMVTQLAPTLNVPMLFNLQAAARCVAKTAVVVAVVLHGNHAARAHVQGELRAAARQSDSDMGPFVSLGYGQPWPSFDDLRADPRTPRATTSGFEHSVALVDVEERWIAYVEFFGSYRFIVDLGPASALSSSALIVNPRAATKSLLRAAVTAPATRVRSALPLMAQGHGARFELSKSTDRAIEECYASGRKAKAEALAAELLRSLDAAGDSEAERQDAIERWSRKLATVESGAAWTEPLDLFTEAPSNR